MRRLRLQTILYYLQNKYVFGSLKRSDSESNKECSFNIQTKLTSTLIPKAGMTKRTVPTYIILKLNL